MEIAELVRDYIHAPTIDSVTWDVARRYFQGNQHIAGIVQEYNFGVSLAYLNIAENVQSRDSSALLNFLSRQIFSVNREMAQRALGDAMEARSACLFVAANVALFARNGPFNVVQVMRMAHLVLSGINQLHPLNEEDPISLEAIPDQELLITPTGHRFSITTLVEYHNRRGYKGTLGEQHGKKFLLNPLINTLFPWHDVPSILVAVARSNALFGTNHVFQGLHPESAVPPGCPAVGNWVGSLQQFNQKVQAAIGMPEIRNEHHIHEIMTGRMVTEIGNDNLRRIWGSLRQQMLEAAPRARGLPPVNAQAPVIRTWIRSDLNRSLLCRVTSLPLAGLQLSWVPKELGGCIGLRKLHLDNNSLKTLPEGVFDPMTALQELHLEHNQLDSLPGDLFWRLSALQRLHLGWNDLRSLSEGIFRGLSALKELHLVGNPLGSLPEGIFQSLSVLEELSLSGQRSISEGLFRGLGRLQCLAIVSTSLSILPERLFHEMVSLQELYLYDNPCLLLCLEDFPMWKNNIACRKIMDEFFNYTCRSPFAAFYKLAAGGSSLEAMERSFSGLPGTIKNAVFRSVCAEAGCPDTNDLQWGEHHAFDDIPRFNGALKRVVRDSFDALSRDQKNALFCHVHGLACNERGAEVIDCNVPNREELHAFDNILRLIDAMDRLHG
jgi:hypothetical protein